MARLKYYLFCIKWLWKNREWKPTRQKFKALENDWRNFVAKELVHKNKSCIRCKYFCFSQGSMGYCNALWKYVDVTNVCNCRCFWKRR